MNIINMIIKGLGIFLCFFVVIMGFLWSLKTGYDNFEGVRYTVDAIGNVLLHKI